MKILPLLLALTISAIGYTNEVKVLKSENHRIYVQPEFSRYIPHTYQNEDRNYKVDGNYYGLNAGYEFLKPDHNYAALEAFVSLGNKFYIGSDGNGVYPFRTDATKSKIEGRLGYNMQFGNFSLIPFYGIGALILSEKTLFHDESQFNTTYIPIGFKAQYNVKNVSVGLKCEQMKHLYFFSRNSSDSYHGNVWNDNWVSYEISAPISFRSADKWEASFEPYYSNIFEGFTFVGGRISAMHNF